MATTKNRDILLVGSMRRASTEDVFRPVANILGDKVHATECGFGRWPRAQDIRELLVHFLTTSCAKLHAWERGRLARSGSGQDGRAPRDCTSTAVEMH